jgi:hypothetical protein
MCISAREGNQANTRRILVSAETESPRHPVGFFVGPSSPRNRFARDDTAARGIWFTPGKSGIS